MDLKEFYFQNIKESEYHHRFLNSVKKVNYTYNLFTGEEETQDYDSKKLQKANAVFQTLHRRSNSRKEDIFRRAKDLPC